MRHERVSPERLWDRVAALIGQRQPVGHDGEAPPLDALRYPPDGSAPALAIRVQELFGLTRHPALLDGAVPLVVELLSPAGRPIQRTVDLPAFWAGSWGEVRAEMRGRYPKHVWPDDPANAAPTRRAKPRKS